MIENMLIKFLKHCFHLTLLIFKLQAQPSLKYIHDASTIPVFQIFVDFVNVRQTLAELTLLNNLLDDETHAKVIFNMSNFTLDGTKYYKSCNHRAYPNPKRTTRFNQASTSVVMPAIRNWLAEGGNIYNIQRSLTSCSENPEFMFLVDSGVSAKSVISTAFMSHRTPPVKLTCKLFVLNPIELDLYVFCHPCGDTPLRGVKINPLNFIEEWRSYNRNLNKIRFSSIPQSTFSTKSNTCYSHYYAGRCFKSSLICVRLTLGKIYNFTDVKIDNEIFPRDDDPPGIQRIYYNLILTMSDLEKYILKDGPWRQSLFIYTLKIVPTVITTISL